MKLRWTMPLAALMILACSTLWRHRHNLPNQQAPLPLQLARTPICWTSTRRAKTSFRCCRESGMPIHRKSLLADRIAPRMNWLPRRSSLRPRTTRLRGWSLPSRQNRSRWRSEILLSNRRLDFWIDHCLKVPHCFFDSERIHLAAHAFAGFERGL